MLGRLGRVPWRPDCFTSSLVSFASIAMKFSAVRENSLRKSSNGVPWSAIFLFANDAGDSPPHMSYPSSFPPLEQRFWVTTHAHGERRPNRGRSKASAPCRCNSDDHGPESSAAYLSRGFLL